MTSNPASTRTLRSDSPEATERFGVELGLRLRAGDVVSLRGVLGAGKTLLVHGLVRGYFEALGTQEDAGVCSPSFTIINVYELDEGAVNHIDLYRLHNIDDLESTGYWDVLAESDALTLIEWLDQIEGAAPPDYLEIAITLENPASPLDSPRVLTLTEVGASAILEREELHL